MRIDANVRYLADILVLEVTKTILIFSFFFSFKNGLHILDIVVIVIRAKQFIFLLHFCTHYFLKLGPDFLNKKLLFHELINQEHLFVFSPTESKCCNSLLYNK